MGGNAIEIRLCIVILNSPVLSQAEWDSESLWRATTVHVRSDAISQLNLGSHASEGDSESSSV